MKVMLLAHEAPDDFALRENEAMFNRYMGAWYAFSNALGEAGALVDAAALEAPQTATVVSVRNGVRTVEDGPFPDAKEQLGGFFIIEAPDMDSAVALARACPAAENGFVDARPVPYLDEETAQ